MGIVQKSKLARTEVPPESPANLLLCTSHIWTQCLSPLRGMDIVFRCVGMQNVGGSKNFGGQNSLWVNNFGVSKM
jgi:hypothetical protein